MITKPCKFGGEDHEYPDDWFFGGRDGEDPRADPRFMPTHYQYLDALAGFSYMSGHFICDDEATDYFTTVANMDPSVKYLAVKRPGDVKFSMLPVEYVLETDTVHDKDWKANG